MMLFFRAMFALFAYDVSEHFLPASKPCIRW